MIELKTATSSAKDYTFKWVKMATSGELKTKINKNVHTVMLLNRAQVQGTNHTHNFSLQNLIYDYLLKQTLDMKKVLPVRAELPLGSRR